MACVIHDVVVNVPTRQPSTRLPHGLLNIGYGIDGLAHTFPLPTYMSQFPECSSYQNHNIVLRSGALRRHISYLL